MARAPVQTLADVLKGNGDAPGVVCAGGGPAYSRGQLENRIKYTANLLRNSGIKPGDTVSIAKTNTVRGICVFDEPVLDSPCASTKQLMAFTDAATLQCFRAASVQNLCIADLMCPCRLISLSHFWV